VDQGRPTADHDPLGDPADIEPRIGSVGLPTGEQLGERHVTRRMAALGERHRTQPQACEAEGARVPGDIVGWYGRASEDVAPGLPSVVVDIAPDRVPYVWDELPLIDQPRVITGQQ
jgi:hypothetical protein